MALERLSPGEPERTDALFALLMSVVTNTAFGAPRKPVPPEEFLPKWNATKTPGRKPVKEVETKMKALLSMFKRGFGK